MNILFLTRRYHPEIGGVETHVNRVAKQLLSDGHTVTIVAEYSEKVAHFDPKSSKSQNRYISAKRTGDRDLALNTGKSAYRKEESSAVVATEEFDEKNTNTIPQRPEIIIYRLQKVKEGWVKKFFIWKQLLKYRTLFENSDIIHCHDVFFWYLPFRILYPRKKVFITFHGYEGVYPPKRKAIIIRRMSEYLSNGAILVGDYIKKWYASSSQYVTYGGVDTIDNEPSGTQNMLDTVSPKILFVGRLEKDTSIPLYLAALKKLRTKGANFTLTVCGEGSYHEQAATLGKVQLVTDVRPFIHEAEIVFASSYLSILQALAYGKLVLAVYDNPLKEDYLKLAPFAPWVVMVSSEAEIERFLDTYPKKRREYAEMLKDGKYWAQQQTWQQVTALYYHLWQGSKPRLLPQSSTNKQQ